MPKQIKVRIDAEGIHGCSPKQLGDGTVMITLAQWREYQGFLEERARNMALPLSANEKLQKITKETRFKK
jgi:hypothetical protein